MVSKNQLKFIQSLHLKKYREEHQLYIIEGIKLVNEYIISPSLKELYCTETYIAHHQELLASRNDIRIEIISSEELKKISLQATPNHVLGICRKEESILNKEALSAGLTLFLDDIKDPGNLGTIIRIADWFGIKQIICSPESTELYNPKTLQATMGAALRVNVVYQSFQNFYTTINTLTTKLPIYGALLHGDDVYSTSLKPGILIIGNEANGISDSVLEKITHPITIPAATNNGSESLNAAIATAILCGEFFRQITIN